MRRSKLRLWGLALAVLFGGAAARAEPPAPLPPGPPPGPPAPIVEQPKAMALPPIGPPPALSEPAPAPASPSSSAHGSSHHGMGSGHGMGNNHAANSHGSDSHSSGHGGNGHGENAHEEEDFDKIFFTGEYLLLRPRRREQDFALVGANPNWGPVGVLKSVEGGFDSGGRFGVGYHWCGGLEAIVQYTHWHNAGNDVVTQSETQRLGLTVFPTLTHPSIVTQVTAARAENSINLNVVDLEMGRRWKQGEQVTWRAYAGPRFVNMDQKYLAVYTGGDVGPGGNDNVRRSLNFNGAGLRAGGEIDYHFWEFFGVYARGSGSMVVGQFRSQLKEVANGAVIVDVSEKYDKLVPIVEAGLGVSFTRGHFRLTVGYEFWNYFGGFEAIDFADDAHPGKPNRRWADLGFDGLAVRAEMSF